MRRNAARLICSNWFRIKHRAEVWDLASHGLRSSGEAPARKNSRALKNPERGCLVLGEFRINPQESFWHCLKNES
jgi:hypothetical protein